MYGGLEGASPFKIALFLTGHIFFRKAVKDFARFLLDEKREETKKKVKKATNSCAATNVVVDLSVQKTLTLAGIAPLLSYKGKPPSPVHWPYCSTH